MCRLGVKNWELHGGRRAHNCSRNEEWSMALGSDMTVLELVRIYKSSGLLGHSKVFLN